MGSQGWGWGGGCGRGGGAAGGLGWFPEGWRWWEPPGPWLKSLLSLRGRPGLGLEWPAAGGLDQGLGVLGWRVVTSRLPLGSSSGRAARKQLFLPCSCSHPGWSPDPAAAGRPGFAPWESEVGGPGFETGLLRALEPVSFSGGPGRAWCGCGRPVHCSCRSGSLRSGLVKAFDTRRSRLRPPRGGAFAEGPALWGPSPGSGC